MLVVKYWSDYYPKYEDRMNAMAKAIASGLSLKAADSLSLV